MRLRRRHIIVAVAGFLLLLWLFCLPTNLFESTPYSTVVTASNGELLGARVAADEQWRFPPCDTLPEKFVKALVEFEDRTFFEHYGVSIRAIARALEQNIRHGRIVSGGSTITMQVIRMSRQKPRTVWQKLIEMFMATRLEARCSKEEILRLYASHASFGGNVVGIGAAMWRYLGDDGAELSWAEAATLAVLQNAPSSVHLAKNRDQLLAKRNRLLSRLRDKGDIDADDYALAVEEPLIGDPYPMPQYSPHLVEWYDREAHGSHITTHIDMGLQRRVDEMLVRWSRELRQKGINDLSAIIVDVRSGGVVAYCGNSDMSFQREGKWVDIIRSPRSSGSILKPLLYAAALQRGTTLPHTLLPDVPTDFGGFAPKNFDGSYAGAIQADRAVTLSLNIPNVYLLKEYGVMSFAETLQHCGLTSLTRPADEYGLSLVLGGAEVRLFDVAMCYAKMSACYQDTTRYQDFPLRNRIALYHTFEAMRAVERPDQMDWRRATSVQNVAWKTGTSYGSRDAWAVGLTPEYVVGVWTGNANGSGVADMTGAHTAGPVMFDLFALLPGCSWFQEPAADEGVEVRVCSHSGHVASRHCTDVTPMMLPAASLNGCVCPYCREVAVSLDGTRRITDRSEATRQEHYFALPPIVEHFYKPQHPEYVAMPPLKENAASGHAATLQFIYPANGSVITLPRQLDGSPGSFVCKVAHTSATTELFWHLDNTYLGSTRDIHQMSVVASKGVHIITVVDASGTSQSVEIVIV